MICVEVPIQTLSTELERLTDVHGQYAELYAKGARDALNWLMNGGEPPSHNTGFPLFNQKAA